MNRKNFVLTITGAVLLLVLTIKFCDRDRALKPDTLPPNTSAIIHLDPSHVDTLTGEGHTGITDYGHGTTVTVKPDGKVDVKVKTIGWVFDAGVGYSQRNKLYLVSEIAFWRRLGWLVGVAVYPLKPNAFTAVSYRVLWSRMNNMSFFTGMDTDTKLIGGIFWRFGNS